MAVGRAVLMVGAVAAFAGSAALGRTGTPIASSPSLDALRSCRAQIEGPARLACYDAAVGKLLDAEAKRDVVVVDREQVRAARRSLFGLSLPDFKLFGDTDGDGTKNAKEAPIDRLETTLVSAQQDSYGKWIFILAEGQRWHQIDDYEIGRKMRPGDKVVVQQAAFGSYKLSVANGSAVRVHREN